MAENVHGTRFLLKHGSSSCSLALISTFYTFDDLVYLPRDRSPTIGRHYVAGCILHTIDASAQVCRTLTFVSSLFTFTNRCYVLATKNFEFLLKGSYLGKVRVKKSAHISPLLPLPRCAYGTVRVLRMCAQKNFLIFP